MSPPAEGQGEAGANTGHAASSDDGGPSLVADPSPWLVYQADEGKPGFDELYAIKEGSIGAQTPLRISGDLPQLDSPRVHQRRRARAGDFASDSRGLAYYRIGADGARVLYWLDTTPRLLASPQRVSGAGRVRDFAWQPSARAAS